MSHISMMFKYMNKDTVKKFDKFVEELQAELVQTYRANL